MNDNVSSGMFNPTILYTIYSVVEQRYKVQFVRLVNVTKKLKKYSIMTTEALGR